MSEVITGGCMCGAVRYAMSEPVRFCLLCHCRDCQRICGTGHSAIFGAARQTTTITGELSLFEYQADSGATMTAGVCARCGNPIFKLSSRHEAFYFLHAATMDQPEFFTPTRAGGRHHLTTWRCGSTCAWAAIRRSSLPSPRPLPIVAKCAVRFPPRESTSIPPARCARFVPVRATLVRKSHER